MLYAPLLLIAPILELVKRPVFWVLYPVAYLFRKQFRSWPLDDVIHNESLKDYGQDVEFCWYGKRSAFVEKFLPYDFCRSWYWGAWRNNGMNLVVILEQLIGPVTVPVRAYALALHASYYEVRTFGKLKLPYCEAWAGSWRFQCGWIKAGRFQIQFKKII